MHKALTPQITPKKHHQPPTHSNWRQFWASAAPGSWLGVLPNAGHTKWLQGPYAESLLLDWAFSGGSASRRVVLEATAACMVAWFTQQLTAGGSYAKAASDPLSFAAAAVGGRAAPAAAPPAVLAAAAVYGEVKEPPAGESGDGETKHQLPPALSPYLEGLVEAGEFAFQAKGGAATAHPL